MKYNSKEIKCECGEKVKLEALKTCAWYAGYNCPKCGPLDRVSTYLLSKEQAEDFIKKHEQFKSYWEN